MNEKELLKEIYEKVKCHFDLDYKSITAEEEHKLLYKLVRDIEKIFEKNNIRL